ncbi:hypothetical protein [Thermoflexus sp.]|uniref:hypothetical protein n=1 Tax=Thermoflexus sp. TaxID=1969742 RepID=UPI0035E437E7
MLALFPSVARALDALRHSNPEASPWRAALHIGSVSVGRLEGPGLAAGAMFGKAVEEAIRLAYLLPAGMGRITDPACAALPTPPAAEIVGVPARELQKSGECIGGDL